MHHLEIAAELLVLVAEDVVAVGAGREDLLYPLRVHDLDRLLRLHLEQVLVPQPARRVAAAGLLLTQHAEAHAALNQQLGEGLRDRDVALGEGA